MIRPRACYNEREREEPGMGAARKYAVIDAASGKLDRRIFSDQAVYDDEMERIFGRAWLMIGHESLVPAPDDFFHPGFAGWIEAIPPKRLKMLGKTRIPTFTRCPAALSRFGLSKPL